MEKRPPIVSDLEAIEQAESYNLWLRAKVAESFVEEGHGPPHDEATKHAHAVVDAKRTSSPTLR